MQAVPVPLVATTRGYPSTGYTIENVHAGSVAVVDASGRLVAWAGDPHYQTFTRSALKPFQALPFLLSDGPNKFGLAQEELALLCASHSGEEKHLAGVQSILGKIGLDAGHLECGCGVPLYYDFVNLPAPIDRQWTPLHHNCSGKHSGFLGWCRLHGAPTAGYVDPEHPLQRAIRASLADAVDLPESSMPTGIDGCSAPNYALPLSKLAHLYARLGQGGQDARLGNALGPLFDAMTGRPDMVSGTERSDLVIMTAGGGDWVAKVGADAVQAIGIRSAGIGIAIKIADGNNRGMHTVTYNVLDQLGLLDDAKRTVLERFRRPEIHNARGTLAGDIRTLFTLQRA
ncbi:asparaginase [Massilia sp.]|jgi:L-asparaginase II|uniref:asparaginase n=1 Tax=Massilia sp. TaxID=1882437 RepID=UPI0028AE44BD|nr:asparaginase [Massilia sp.]